MTQLFVPEGMEICPECDGKGKAVYSCCTGELITGDYEMCHVCHEWLGEEDCNLCEDNLYVPVNSISADKIDVGMMAENVVDMQKEMTQ